MPDPARVPRVSATTLRGQLTFARLSAPIPASSSRQFLLISTRCARVGRRFVSSMTCRAAGELLDLILLNEPLSELELIGRRFVVDAEHGRPRADVPLRIAMTVEAPFHLQRLLLPHERHSIDRPVTRRAPDSLVNVNAVVEVDEI